MLKVVTAQEMQELDRRATAEYGIPSLLLMEHAGAETAREIREAIPAASGGRVVVLCGRGNNGGDGFVVARHLLARGAQVETFLLARREEVKGDARVNLEILEKLRAAPTQITEASGLGALVDRVAASDLVVDALLGTGTRGPVEGLFAEAIQAVNRAGRPVAAVDIPSGLIADSPEAAGPAVRAALTVTFALPKPCLLLHPAAGYAGSVRVADIGIPRALLQDPTLRLGLLEAADVVAAFPPRDPASHKGTFGHVLVVAGSVGKTGAAALCALAAQRGGAGLVTLGVPESLNDILEVKLTEVMTEPLPETEARTLAGDSLKPLLALAEGKSAVAIGPGLTTHPSTRQLVCDLLTTLRLPMVLDADGINALEGRAEILARATGPVILTPHPGELSRLLRLTRTELLARRISVAQETAAAHHVTLVLKMARSLIAGPGGEIAIVPTGNPGMATGGTGDVLTGLIAGLLAQGMAPGLAAQAGAYVHGLAGDLAATRLGQEAMLAGDLLDCLPQAIRQVKTGKNVRRFGGSAVPQIADPEGTAEQPNSRTAERF
ncbi:MAG TPA: NAD(P)H-hydrate dehydratase [Candidatus Methylomirabilis sp.]|nr:NAD(P)H-hydrate dehydratase [Candidatus Methylomirabilis sp.]